MNGKQAKRARSVAHAYAEREKLWKNGEASVYSKWWRKFVARLFPRLRKRYADWVGRWYKRTLKDLARQVFASVHDRELQAERRKELRAYRVARVKINRNWREKRLKE